MSFPHPFHAHALPLALGLLAASAACAHTATGLSSFEAIEEPLVRFYPATGKFVPDYFVNITDQGGGTFRMFHRFNVEWWDGDRDTTNKDRQRAEVKGLGPHQFHGDTFTYSTTWRASPGFHASGGFCHIFQLKATNGDSGAPLVTISLHPGKVTVEANPAGKKIIAREFPWKLDTWQTVVLRIKVSPNHDGELLASVDGDEFQGARSVELSRPEANEYRPKWGLYRRAAVGAKLGDDFIEHKNVTAQNVQRKDVDNAALETEARRIAKNSSPLKGLEWLLAKPASGARDFAVASIAALWAETNPAAAMSWTEKLPPGALRDDATARVFVRWADRDVPAAAEWLRAHAPHPSLDALVWLFATDTTYRYVNRPVALDACALVQDSTLRGKAYEHVVEIWSRNARAEAASFVEGCASLTATQKKTILEKIGTPRSSTSRPILPPGAGSPR